MFTDKEKRIEISSQICSDIKTFQDKAIESVFGQALKEVQQEVDANQLKEITSGGKVSSNTNTLDIAAIINQYYEVISEIAQKIVDNTNWSSQYSEELYKHCYGDTNSDKSTSGKKPDFALNPSEFYSAETSDIEDKLSKIPQNISTYIKDNLNIQEIFVKARDKVKASVQRIFSRTNILNRSEYIIHNKWYDKEWFEATRINLITRNNRIDLLEFMQEQQNKRQVNYYCASESVFTLLFGSEKMEALEKSPYSGLKKYIEVLCPNKEVYTLMLNNAIPALSKYKVDPEQNGANTRFTAALRPMRESDMMLTTMKQIVFKAFCYPLNDVAYVPCKQVKTAFSNMIQELGVPDLNKLITLAEPELQTVIRKNRFLIPKVLTFNQMIDASIKDVEVESGKLDDFVCSKYTYFNYLYDVICYDGSLIALKNKRPRANEKYKIAKKPATWEQTVSIFTQYYGEIADKELVDLERKLEDCNGKKDKISGDHRSKTKRDINKLKNFNEVIMPLITKRWAEKLLGTNFSDITDETKLRLRKAICLALIVYYISADSKAILEFMDSNAIVASAVCES